MSNCATVTSFKRILQIATITWHLIPSLHSSFFLIWEKSQNFSFWPTTTLIWIFQPCGNCYTAEKHVPKVYTLSRSSYQVQQKNNLLDLRSTIIGHMPKSFHVNAPANDKKFKDNLLPKWVTPAYMYNQTNYPKFVVGGAYIMHRDMIDCLYEGKVLCVHFSKTWERASKISASLDLPLSFLNDIFITGMARMACGFQVQDDRRFTQFDIKWPRVTPGLIALHRCPDWKKPIYHSIFSEQDGVVNVCGPFKYCLDFKRKLVYCGVSKDDCKEVTWWPSTHWHIQDVASAVISVTKLFFILFVLCRWDKIAPCHCWFIIIYYNIQKWHTF